jgi:hypothetical protein
MTSTTSRRVRRAYTSADCLIAEVLCTAAEKAMRHRNRRQPRRAARLAARACVALVSMAGAAVGIYAAETASALAGKGAI